MDFSSKYGIGYLLSNGSSGFYFNDGTSLILSSHKRRGHFFQPGEDNKKILVREEGRFISFIDQEKRCLLFPASISRVHLTSAITSKLQYVSEIFSNMVKTASSGHVKAPSGLGQAVYSSNSK